MPNNAYDQFSFELRQFRISNDMSRAALASLLGISASTLKQWEDGRAKVRTYKLWEVYERLKVFEGQSNSQNIPFSSLLEIFDKLIEQLELANVNADELLKREIDRKLSKTILRAAQTDFALSQDRRAVVPVPFTEDLELFRNNRLIDIEQLLQSIVANIEDTIPHIENANLNSERLVELFHNYIQEANKDIPNPRILHRKGEILRRQLQKQDTRLALTGWDVEAIDGFVEDHQELMRLYFGEALLASHEVERAQMNDRILPDARKLIREAISAFETYDRERGLDDLTVDARVPAILSEIEREVADYEFGLHGANTPSIRSSAAGRIKNSLKHVGIFVARFMLRVATIAKNSTLATGGLLAWLELVAPGSFRAIYETIRLSFPALPPLF